MSRKHSWAGFEHVLDGRRLRAKNLKGPVKFNTDAILEETLRPRVEAIGGTLEKVSLSGNHITPCIQVTTNIYNLIFGGEITVLPLTLGSRMLRITILFFVFLSLIVDSSDSMSRPFSRFARKALTC
ncbi:hypothetical protein HanPI659440_Chr04g0160781 [Helianthus annuus]|nr:hypothetical protein HanPI659440_Chr04g0160781 [Helianthus annuus]